LFGCGIVADRTGSRPLNPIAAGSRRRRRRHWSAPTPLTLPLPVVVNGR